MSLPRCPRCYTPIEPDWDHCHTCGLTEAEIEEALSASEADSSSPRSSLPPSTPPLIDTEPATAPPPSTGSEPPGSSRSSEVPEGPGHSWDSDQSGESRRSPPSPAGAKVAPLAPGGVSPVVVGGAVAAAILLIVAAVVLFRPSAPESNAASSEGTSPPPLGQLGIERSTTTSPTTEPPSPYPPGRGGWIIYTAPDGRFTAEYPKVPLALPGMLPVGNEEVPATSYVDMDANGGYLVMSVDLPAGDDPQQSMQRVISAWAAFRDGQVTKSAPSEGRLQPTRTATVTMPTGTFNVTAFSTPNRVFLVGSGGTDARAYPGEHLLETFSPQG